MAHVRKLSYATIQNYLTIVKHLHAANGLADPIRDSWAVRQVLSSARRQLGDSQIGAHVATPKHLLGIYHDLDLSDLNDLSGFVACPIGFVGFLRPGNFLFNVTFVHLSRRRTLTIDQVSLHPRGFVIIFEWSKTLQFRERVLKVPLPSLVGHPIYPTSALRRLLQLHEVLGDPKDSPLLCCAVNKALGYKVFIEKK